MKITYRGFIIKQTGGNYEIVRDDKVVHTARTEYAAYLWIDAEHKEKRQ